MNFNKHYNLEGQHAFLSASQYHWLNYDSEKLRQAYKSQLARQKGTELHALAEQCIRLGVRLPRSKKTLSAYVNDGIGFKMQTEQILFYSENCFGTADAISYRNNHLQIHDLKTGISRTSMDQLYIYAALFCLEYRVDPRDITIELRIYQNDEVKIDNPLPETILDVMDQIVTADREIDILKLGV